MKFTTIDSLNRLFPHRRLSLFILATLLYTTLPLGAQLETNHSTQKPSPQIATSDEAQFMESERWYHGSAQLPQGWRLEGWGGMTAGVNQSVALPNRNASIKLAPKNEEMKAWAGVKIIRLGASPASSRLLVSTSEGGEKALNMQIRTDPAMPAQNNLPLQVSVAFLDEEGKTHHSEYLHVRPSESADAHAASSGWKQISLPLSELCQNKKIPRANIQEITQIDIQTAAITPILETFFIGELEIGAFIPPSSPPPPPSLDHATTARFRKISELEPPFLVPRNVIFPIDAQGNFTFEGKPRFLLGAELPEWLKKTYEPTSGYASEFQWIYEEPLNYESAQRIGLDSIGLFMPPRWVPLIDPARSGVIETNGVEIVQKVIKEAQLPLYVDMTCSEWLHGALEHSKAISPLALNTGGSNGAGNHWVPYSVTTPEGRALYFKMFSDTAAQIVSAGGRALFYELFNEPAYDDPSPYNRQLFANRLERLYGDISKLNSLWKTSYKNFTEVAGFHSETDCPALTVEWSKFMEDSFADLCREGIQVIHAIDTNNPATTVQMLGGDYYRVLPKSHVNMYKLGKLFPIIELCTGGGIEAPGAGGLTAAPAHTIEIPYISHRFEGIVERRFFLSIAEGKPIVDGEHYFQAHSASDGFWLQLARGGNAAFIFHWNKRAWDAGWGEKKDAVGGRKMAELYPYNVLNPYAVSTEKLADIATAKREILSLSDLFGPRQNLSRPLIGLLLSYSTERYSQGSGNTAHNFFRNYGVAMEFSHFDYGVILEEQIAEGHLDHFKILVAAGVENLPDGILPRIHQWVENGGTLILAVEGMQKNEIGNIQEESAFLHLKLGKELNLENTPLEGNIPRLSSLPGFINARASREILNSPEWEQLASLDKIPAILRRSLGKGHIYFINAKMSDYAVSSLLGGILKESGINPLAELTRADNQELEGNIELRKFSHENETGFFLFNWDSYPKMFSFRAPELSAGSLLVDPLRKESFKINDGAAMLWIPPNTKRVLVIRPSDTAPLPMKNFLPQDAAAVAAKFAIAHDESSKGEKGNEKKDFSVHGAKILTVDLRAFANRGFHDEVAGDGKGGWTDQGENSLHGEEWGRQVYRGVPFEIIRSDMNGGKGVIVLSSSSMKGDTPSGVSGIPLEESHASHVRRLFFLHATGWTEEGTEAMRYVLHRTDGSSTEIPIRCGKEIGDWWISEKQSDLSETTRIAWKNMENRGFWVTEWVNPEPEKPISSIEVRSSGNKPVPLVIAITAELQ